VIPGHLKVGWKIAFKLPLYVKVLKTNAGMSKVKAPWLGSILNPLFTTYNGLQKLTRFHFSNRYTVKNQSLSELQSDSAAYNEFIGEWYTAQKNYLIKDLEFLKW